MSHRYDDMHRNAKSKSSPALPVIVGGAVILMIMTIIILAMSAERIEAGTACVIRTNGKTTGVAEPGWEWMKPGIDSLRCYPTRVQSIEFTGQESDANFSDTVISHKSSDVVNLNVAAIMYFRIEQDHLEEIHDNFGRSMDELVEKQIQAIVRRHTRDVLEERTIEEIYPGGMADTSAEIEERLIRALAERGVVVDSFALTAVDPSDEYKAAVQQQIEQQQQAELEAERVTVEEQRAEQLRVQAQGEADADVIRAQGEADANAVLDASLTENVLQLEYLQTLRTINWAIFGPDDVQPMIPIETPEEEEESSS